MRPAHQIAIIMGRLLKYIFVFLCTVALFSAAASAVDAYKSHQNTVSTTQSTGAITPIDYQIDNQSIEGFSARLYSHCCNQLRVPVSIKPTMKAICFHKYSNAIVSAAFHGPEMVSSSHPVPDANTHQYYIYTLRRILV